MEIKKVSCEQFAYEVGKNDVAKIELTDHGSDTTTIYKVSGANGELVVHAGLLVPHEVEYSCGEAYEQITIFDFEKLY